MANNPAPATPKASTGGVGGGTSDTTHHLFAAFAGELIGIAVLAVFADMSDDLGSVAVALMGGWFLIFIMANSSGLAGIFSKV